MQQKLIEMDEKLNQVLIDQQAMKENLKTITDHVVDTAETVTILVHKAAEHEIDIQKLKRRLMD